MPIPEHEPLPPTTPAPPSHPASAAASGPAPAPSKWGPYSGAADFTANMATILVALFCALFLAVAANAVVRHFIRRRRARLSVGLPVTTGCKEAPAARCEAITLPVLVFSRRGTTLAGDGPPECAICLSEFADGDRVRVIPACNHGFHVSCVEAWLASTPSCPTCRSSCKADAASGGNSGAGRACTVGEPTTQSGAADERAPMAPSMHGR